MSAQRQAATLTLNAAPTAQQMRITSSRGLQTLLVQTPPSSLLSVQAHNCKQGPPKDRHLWVSIASSAYSVCCGGAVSPYPALLQMRQSHIA